MGADVSVSADGIRKASYRLAVSADLVADLAIPAPCLPDDGGTALEGGGVGEHLPHLLYCKWALPIDGLPGKRVIWSAHTNPFFVVVKLLLYCLWTGVPPELIDAVSGDPEADGRGYDHQSDPDVGEETDAQLDEEPAEGDDNGGLQQSGEQTASWFHTASRSLLLLYICPLIYGSQP